MKVAKVVEWFYSIVSYRASSVLLKIANLENSVELYVI